MNLIYNMDRYIIKKCISDEFINEAKNYMLNKTLNRSITSGARNLMSTIAELYYLDMMSHIPHIRDIEYPRTTDYDVLLNGVKIDIKTKQRTVEPKKDYMASIVAYSKNIQKCEWYAFCQINVNKSGNFTDFYYIGAISKEKFFKKAIFKKKGESDGDNMVNGSKFLIREDCYNLSYDKLNLFTQESVDIILPKGYEAILWK